MHMITQTAHTSLDQASSSCFGVWWPSAAAGLLAQHNVIQASARKLRGDAGHPDARCKSAECRCTSRLAALLLPIRSTTANAPFRPDGLAQQHVQRLGSRAPNAASVGVVGNVASQPDGAQGQVAGVERYQPAVERGDVACGTQHQVTTSYCKSSQPGGPGHRCGYI